MVTDPVDKTIEKITEVIAENEVSLPKAAPTQHSINNLSLRLSEEYSESDVSTSVICLRENREPERSTRTFERLCGSEGLCGRSERELRWIQMGRPSNLHELRERLLRSPVSSMRGGTPLFSQHEVRPERSYFMLRCKECNFRFRSESCSLELAHQHSNWNNHRVVITLNIDGIEDNEMSIDIFPTQPSWRERYPYFSRFMNRFSELPTRFYRSLWCGGVFLSMIVYDAYLFLITSGTAQWLSVLATGWWSFNFYQWWKNWQERRKDTGR